MDVVYDSRYVKFCGLVMYVNDPHEHKAMSGVCAIAPSASNKVPDDRQVSEENSKRHRPPNVL